MQESNALKDLVIFFLEKVVYRSKAKVKEAHCHSIAAQRLSNALLRKTTAAVDEAAGFHVAAAAEEAVLPVSA